MRYLVLVLVFCMLIGVIGCGDSPLRFAPTQQQKQSAYLLDRTVQTAAVQAKVEGASEQLQALTSEATNQTAAVVSFYGMPQEIPPSSTADDLLLPENKETTQQAAFQSTARPDPWDVADHFLEMGIALAGVVGGVYGSKAAGAIGIARQKSQALREVVRNNEVFKREAGTETAKQFNQAQGVQSDSTKKIVSELRT